MREDGFMTQGCREITGTSLVAPVRSGAKFGNSFLIERDETVVA